ncbi:conserved hypothetical protein [Cupriavidus taiwanensis]|nr:conserved hypothetical protein [Cupriavidus taiwanensis]SPA02428.1 conserved hypothetical protein [Cupriavidus taiwanensis]
MPSSSGSSAAALPGRLQPTVELDVPKSRPHAFDIFDSIFLPAKWPARRKAVAGGGRYCRAATGSVPVGLDRHPGGASEADLDMDAERLLCCVCSL